MMFHLPSSPVYFHPSTRDDLARNILLSHSDNLSSFFKREKGPELRSSSLIKSSLKSQLPNEESSLSSSPPQTNALKVSFTTNEQYEPFVKIHSIISSYSDGYPQNPRKTPRERRLSSDSSFNYGKREFEHLIFPSPQKELAIENHSNKLYISHPSDVSLFEINHIVSVSMLLATQGVGSKLFHVTPNKKEIKLIPSAMDALFETYFGLDALQQRSFPYLPQIKAYLYYCRQAVNVGNLFLNLEDYAHELSRKSIFKLMNGNLPKEMLSIYSETDSGAGRELLLQLRSMSNELLQDIRALSKNYMDGTVPTSPFRIFMNFKVRIRSLSILKSAVLNSRDNSLLRGDKLFLNLSTTIPPSLQSLGLFKAALTPLLRIFSQQLGVFIPTKKGNNQNCVMREGDLSSVVIIEQSENTEDNGNGDLSCYSLHELPEFLTDETLDLSLESIKRCAETVMIIRKNSPSLANAVCPSSLLFAEQSIFHKVDQTNICLHDLDRVHESVYKARRYGLKTWKQKVEEVNKTETLTSNTGTNGFDMSTVLDRFALSTAEQSLRNTALVRERKARINEELEAARLASVELKQREFERITKDLEDAVKLKKALRKQQQQDDKELINALAAADKALANPLRGTAWDGEKETLYSAARIEILKTFGDKIKAHSTRPEDRISVEGQMSTDEAVAVALDALSALGASGIRQAAILANNLNVSYPSDQNRRRAAAPKDSLNIFQDESAYKNEKSNDNEEEEEEEKVLVQSTTSSSSIVIPNNSELIDSRDEEVVDFINTNNESDSHQSISVNSMNRGNTEGLVKRQPRKKKSSRSRFRPEQRELRSSSPSETDLMSSEEELNIIWAGTDPVLPAPLSPSALASIPGSSSGFVSSLQSRFLGSSDISNKEPTETRLRNKVSGQNDAKKLQQMRPLSVVVHHGLLAPLARHITLVDEAGALLVRIQGHLCFHYQSLHQWMLLGSGHCASKFVDDLLHTSMFKLSVSVALDSFSRTDDSIVFDRARARAVSLANKAFERAQSGDLLPGRFAYKIAKLSSNTKRNAMFDGKKWWSSKALDIIMSPRYETPLGELESLVLTPSMLSSFEIVHMFLLSLRRTKALLSSSWTLLRRNKNHASDSEQALYLFIFDSFLALNALDRYLFLEVIDNGFKILISDTERALTISEMKDILFRFLNKCMLNEGHIAAIQSIQDVILNVCAVVEGAISAETSFVSDLAMIVASHKKLRYMIEEGLWTRN
jgi:hypothetical protein